MLRHILFDLNLFENEQDRANSQKRVLVLLEALTLCNQFYLQEHPNTPLLYQSGIEYKLPGQMDGAPSPLGEWLKASRPPADAMREYQDMAAATGGEVFRDIPRILENGGGDCDNLAAWRAAEIRHHIGDPAKPYITWRKRPDGGTTYHVICCWSDGSSEDPSLLLGMPSHDGTDKDRIEEERKLGERAAEFAEALQMPRPNQIANNLVKKAQLEQVVGLLLKGGYV